MNQNKGRSRVNASEMTIALAFASILALALYLLWPGTHGTFIFDDFPYFERLSRIGGHLTWESYGRYVASYPGPLGRVMSISTFLLNDVAWPSTADTFKRTNVFVHLLNGVLLFGLARAVARTRLAPRPALLAALVAMAAWLLHPIQTSAVFLTVQRITLLSAMWVLVALWVYVALLTRARNLKGSVLALTALAALTGLGVLSKENALLAFLFAASLNVTVLAPTIDRLDPRSRNLVLWAPLVPIVLAIAVVTLKWHELNAYTLRDFTPLERLMTEWRVLLDYLQRLLLPRLSGTGIYNDDYVVSHGLLDPPSTLLALVILVAMASTAWVFRRRAPLYSLAVLWFLSGHLIESTVMDLELFFEHRNYAPSIGMALAIGIAAAGAGGKLRRVAPVAIGLWMALLAFNTWHQARLWGDPVRQAAVWLAEHPRSPRAYQQMADVYFRAGQAMEARKVMQAGLGRGVSPANFSLSMLLIDCNLQRPLDPELLATAKKTLRSDTPNPGTAHALRDLRLAIVDRRCANTLGLDQWVALTDAAMANPRRQSSEAFIRLERSAVFATQRNLDATMREIEQAYAVSPEPEMAEYAAQVLMSAGLFDEAKKWIERARTAPLSAWRAYVTNRDTRSEEFLRNVERLQQRTNARSVPGSTPPAGGQLLPQDAHNAAVKQPRP